MRPTASSPQRRVVRSALIAALALGLLSACADSGDPGPATPRTDVEREEALEAGIEELDGVASVDIGGMEPRDEHPRYTTVTVDGEADAETVLAASDGVADLAARMRWEDPITMRADPPGAATADAGAPASADPWWSLEVHPTTDAAATRAMLAALLEAARVDGVVGLSVVDGWPYAALLEPDRVADRFDELRDTSLFARGGTFSLRSEQPWLKFTHVEGGTSPRLIEELVAISEAYPHSEVLLEAPRFPRLYVARVTTAEAEGIAVRLADPSLRDGVDPEAGPIAWQVTSPDGDGTGYWEGEVGSG
ncbi:MULTISPECIES: hypothetical protein [unclassified Agromyces]|uniref:hypothetical protein n=1 Tax=unclassified Agromyces TaxID=2639701 RepID=UPI0030153021